MAVDPHIIRAVALPPFIDLGATALFSITGAMVAIRRHYDVVGVFVLALASFFGVAVFALLTVYLQFPTLPTAIAAIAITSILRVLAIRFDWKTRPVVAPPPPV